MESFTISYGKDCDAGRADIGDTTRQLGTS